MERCTNAAIQFDECRVSRTLQSDHKKILYKLSLRLIYFAEIMSSKSTSSVLSPNTARVLAETTAAALTLVSAG